MSNWKISFHKQLQLWLFALFDTPVTTEEMNGQHIKAKTVWVAMQMYGKIQQKKIEMK